MRTPSYPKGGSCLSIVVLTSSLKELGGLTGLFFHIKCPDSTAGSIRGSLGNGDGDGKENCT